MIKAELALVKEELYTMQRYSDKDWYKQIQIKSRLADVRKDLYEKKVGTLQFQTAQDACLKQKNQNTIRKSQLQILNLIIYQLRMFY